MPAWPFFILATAGLTYWGHAIGGGAWRVPALALAGYLMMRVLVGALDYPVLEFATFTLWAGVAICMAMVGGYAPAVLFMIAAALYPVMFWLGFRLEYLGLLPILSDIIAVVALVGIGGGLYARTDRAGVPDRTGSDSVLAFYTVGPSKG